MATPTIPNGEEYFNTKLYEGNGTAIGSGGNTITSLDFQPDLVWIKNRDAGDSHALYDSSRGATKQINPDVNTAESTQTEGLTSFTSNGFTLGNLNIVNTNNESFVSWNWLANGGTTTNIDTSGDPTIASVVQVNQTAGFSIIQFEGTFTASQKVGHGLSQPPEWVVCKPLDISAGGWAVYHKDLSSASHTLFLDSDGKEASTSTMWQGLAPDSTVINVGANSSSNRNSSMVHYAWHSVDGFSKFGSYIGNGGSGGNGTFIYTGFKPAWLMVKCTSTAGRNWAIFDVARSPLNPFENCMNADLNSAEQTTGGNTFDFLSNGFKLRGTNTKVNGSGSTYVYMAFAEHPFVGDGVSPVTAR